MKSTLSVTVDPRLIGEIDYLRGREKRSTFVEHLLRIGLREERQKRKTAVSEGLSGNSCVHK